MLDDQDTPQMDACATFPAIGRALQLIANIPAWHVGAFLTVSGRLNASFCAATGESPADGDFLQAARRASSGRAQQQCAPTSPTVPVCQNGSQGARLGGVRGSVQARPRRP